MSYNILCLSGGGVRGIFQAALMKHMEEEFQADWEKFDLIIGTSTGAVLALALALGTSAADVLGFYKSAGQEIFKKKNGEGLRGNDIMLEKALEGVFEDKTLNDCNPDVAIPTIELEDASITVFSILTREIHGEITAVEAAMASAAAPEFFSAYEVKGHKYVDGGIWANTPSLAGLTLAYQARRIEFKDMRVLHIGNGGGVFKAPGDGDERTKHEIELEMAYAAQNSIAREVCKRLLVKNAFLDIDVVLEKPIKLHEAEKAMNILPGAADRVFAEKKRKLRKFLRVSGVIEP